LFAAAAAAAAFSKLIVIKVFQEISFENGF
jgi:hypothetical protein